MTKRLAGDNNYDVPGARAHEMDWEKDWDGAPRWLRDLLNYCDHPLHVSQGHHAEAEKAGRDKVSEQLGQMEKITTRETYGRDHPCYTRKIDKGFDPLVRRRK